MSNIAQDTLRGQSPPGASLEDMFVSRGDLEKKLARAKQWEALPRRPGERAHFDHSEQAAAESHARGHGRSGGESTASHAGECVRASRRQGVRDEGVNA